MSNYQDRWEIVKELGGGGQGKVYEVVEKLPPSEEMEPLWRRVKSAISTLNSAQNEPGYIQAADDLKIGLMEMLEIVPGQPRRRGALKVLQDTAIAADPEQLQPRLIREIAAMQSIEHPNLLRLIDAGDEGLWYVSELQPGGTLEENSERYTGRSVDAMRALLPLVEGVAQLHANGNVHRDIKPGNIFIGENDQLVLGDFGLIFSPEETRMSDTWDNVGTRDWMPAWAQTHRYEEVAATFDTFALGKVLWSMVSNDPKLLLWYWDQPDNDLEQKFPHDENARFVNQLLRECVVEHEEHCMKDAGQLLDALRSILQRIDRGGQFLGSKGGLDLICRFCGAGMYAIGAVEGNTDKRASYGIANAPDPMRILECDYCGHVEMFRWRDKEPPKAFTEPTGSKD